MWILVIATLLIPVIYIGYLVSNVDKFFAKGGFKSEEDNITSTAIVLGETDLAKEIIVLLKKNNIPVLNLVEPFILDKELNFRYLIALSEKDVDNLVLCKIGKKLYTLDKIISLCNDRKNERMFTNEKITYFLGEQATPQMLYQFLIKEDEVRI
ncbi:hypothetical protein [Clostridium sp.]|uniref:hypothetical protein n=1 Tax=Clostridium sp. TaxID=1506 RepID=UPI002FC60219